MNASLAQLLPLILEITADLADGKLDADEKRTLIAHAGPLVAQLIAAGLIKPEVVAPVAPPSPVVGTQPAPAPPFPFQPVPAPPVVLPFPVRPQVEDWTVDEIRGEIMFFEGDREAPDAEVHGIRGKLYPAH